MSSFNVSCGLTHQTISPGDKCTLLFVKQALSSYVQGEVESQNLFGNSTILNISEPDAYWIPYGKILHVEYEDVGYFNLVNEGNTFENAFEIVRDMFTKNLIIDADESENEEDRMEFNFVTMLEKNCPKLYLHLVLQGELETSQEELFEELNTAMSYIQTFSRIGQMFYPSGNNLENASFVSLLTFPMHEVAYKKMLEKTAKYKREDGYDNSIAGKVESLLEDIDKAIAFDNDDVKAFDHLHTSMPYAEVKMFNAINKALIDSKRVVTQEHGERLFGRYFEVSSLLESMEALDLKLMPKIFSRDNVNNENGLEYANLVVEVANSLSQKRKLKI